jgi:pimeloyl-ACP methyl ester carboxylesterase
LYSVEDETTQDNAFLFYNKAINSAELRKEQMDDKAGLNSIRLEGRSYLLRNALVYWDNTNHQNFVDFDGPVMLIYSRDDILLRKTDMLWYTFRPDADRTVLKSRGLVEIEGGHDVQTENY